MSTHHRSSSSTSRNPRNAPIPPAYSTRSRHLNHLTRRLGPRLSTREKVDDVLRYIRDEYNWSAAQFVVHFMTAPSKELHATAPEARRKRFIRQIEEEGLHWVTMLQEADVCLDASEQQLVSAARREMDELIAKSIYFGRWDASAPPDNVDMEQATEDMITHAPYLYGFLKQISAHKRSHQSSSFERSNKAVNFRILGMLSNMCNLYLREGSNWLQKTIGVHFGNLGIKRRGIELFATLGYCPSYKTITKDLDNIAKHSRARNSLDTYPLDDVDFAEGRA